jgi:hypothetical protein
MPLHDLVNQAGVQPQPQQPSPDLKEAKDSASPAAAVTSILQATTTTPVKPSVAILDDNSSTGSVNNDEDAFKEGEGDGLDIDEASANCNGNTAANLVRASGSSGITIQKTDHKKAEEAGLHLAEPLLQDNPHRFVLFPIQDAEVRWKEPKRAKEITLLQLVKLSLVLLLLMVVAAVTRGFLLSRPMMDDGPPALSMSPHTTPN